MGSVKHGTREQENHEALIELKCPRPARHIWFLKWKFISSTPIPVTVLWISTITVYPGPHPNEYQNEHLEILE